MIKKAIPILMLLLFLTLLAISAGCERVESNERPLTSSSLDKSLDNQESPQDPIKIGFSMDTLEEERWLRDKHMFKDAVKAIGAEIEIMEANGDEALQISQVETLISKGVDVLVIVPYNADAAAAIVTKAHQAGIKVISYDRLIKNAEIDLYISFDNEKVGEMQAEMITELVPKGKYVYIGGAATDNNAHLIKKGVYNILQPLIDKGFVKVVYDQWTENWIPENAYSNMAAALEANNNKIDAVIAANDATAGEAIKALESIGLSGKVPVAGQDAELAAAQRIVVGTQSMTVYKPIKMLAEEAAKAAVMLAKGEIIETNSKINNGKIEVPSILLPPIAVDKQNIEETIIADGFHTKEEVYRYVDDMQ
jgi:D-xylose transport system substrate-binding protein